MVKFVINEDPLCAPKDILATCVDGAKLDGYLEIPVVVEASGSTEHDVFANSVATMWDAIIKSLKAAFTAAVMHLGTRPTPIDIGVDNPMMLRTIEWNDYAVIHVVCEDDYTRCKYFLHMPIHVFALAHAIFADAEIDTASRQLILTDIIHRDIKKQLIDDPIIKSLDNKTIIYTMPVAKEFIDQVKRHVQLNQILVKYNSYRANTKSSSPVDYLDTALRIIQRNFDDDMKKYLRLYLHVEVAKECPYTELSGTPFIFNLNQQGVGGDE